MLRDESMFNLIASSYGRIVLGSDFSWDENDCSCGKVMILAPPGPKINDHMFLNWKNSVFKIWVYEDIDQWFPSMDEFLEIEEDDNESIPGMEDFRIQANDDVMFPVNEEVANNFSRNQESNSVNDSDGLVSNVEVTDGDGIFKSHSKYNRCDDDNQPNHNHFAPRST